jgi:hypothetical protein
MAKNQVQFQKGLSLPEFLRQYCAATSNWMTPTWAANAAVAKDWLSLGRNQ